MARIEGFEFPDDDQRCHPVVLRQVSDLDKVLPLIPWKHCAIQAGANVGVWPARLALEFDTVYTFEPDAENFACLEKNVSAANIVYQWGALGEKLGFAGMEREKGNCGAHRMNGEGDIPIYRIDDMNLAPDFIQLDIEGFELFALKGAERTINTYLPVIMVEDKGLGMKYGVQNGEIAQWLAEFGYRREFRIHRDDVYTCHAKNG